MAISGGRQLKKFASSAFGEEKEGAGSPKPAGLVGNNPKSSSKLLSALGDIAEEEPRERRKEEPCNGETGRML